MGNPVLTQQARPVLDPTAHDLNTLVLDMIETMIAAPGVGLAAPQVGASLQLVVFQVPPGRGLEEVALTVLLNPQIEPLDDRVELGYEGCLSIPGLTGPVPRWSKIGYRGLGLDGKLIEREAEGFHARVVQHECDHLVGRLYPTRMTDLSKLAFVDELQRQSEAPE